MKKDSCVGELAGSVVFDYAVKSVEGRLLTFVEAMGLPEGQEKATKDIIRQELWGVFKDSVYISGDQVLKVREENKKMDGSTPIR